MLFSGYYYTRCIYCEPGSSLKRSNQQIKTILISISTGKGRIQSLTLAKRGGECRRIRSYVERVSVFFFSSTSLSSRPNIWQSILDTNLSPSPQNSNHPSTSKLLGYVGDGHGNLSWARVLVKDNRGWRGCSGTASWALKESALYVGQ